MPRTRQNAETNEGFNPAASRQAHAGSIPRRTAESTVYNVWTPEIQYLRENLGTSAEYPDVPKAQSVVSGLRRLHGILAKSRGVNKETGVGTVWLEYPSVEDDDGNLTEDTETVKEIMDTYAK